MKEKVIRCLEFNELNEEQKKKVLEKYRDINVEDFTQVIDEYKFKEPIEEAGFNNPYLNWDLSCSQGSGASFDCDSIDVSKALKDWDYHHKKWVIQILEQFYTVKVSQNSFANHYVHEKTRYVSIKGYLPDFYSRIEDGIEVAIKYIERLRLDLCGDLYKSLQDEYDNLTSDEMVIETLEANEYLFNEETLSIEVL